MIRNQFFKALTLIGLVAIQGGCGGGGGGNVPSPPASIQELRQIRLRVQPPSGTRTASRDALITVFFMSDTGNRSEDAARDSEGFFHLSIAPGSQGFLVAKSGQSRLEAPLTDTVSTIDSASTLQSQLMKTNGLSAAEAGEMSDMLNLQGDSPLLKEIQAAWFENRQPSSPSQDALSVAMQVYTNKKQSCESGVAWCLLINPADSGGISEVWLIRQSHTAGAIGGLSYQLELAGSLSVESVLGQSDSLIQDLYNGGSNLARGLGVVKNKSGLNETTRLFKIKWKGQAAGQSPARVRNLQIRGPMGQAHSGT